MIDKTPLRGFSDGIPSVIRLPGGDAMVGELAQAGVWRADVSALGRGEREEPARQSVGMASLLNATVKGDRGELLGRIRDLVLDAVTGNIIFAVMSVGGLFGIGDRLFAIPWRKLRLNPAGDCLHLSATRERLDSAPGFDRNHWPTKADDAWLREDRDDYGPHWDY